MKDNRKRRSLRPWRPALLGAMLPLALTSTAQTSLQWRQPEPAATQSVTAHPESPTRPMPYRTSLSSQPPVSLPAGFDVAAFERMAQQLTVGRRVPGLALAIVQNGRVLSARGYGVTDVSAPQSVDAHTVFRLASLSKGFAGTLTGLLVNDGALRWDSKVVDYVPGFRLNDPAATRQLTVADVISHRTGLRVHNAFDRDIENNAAYYTVAHKLASAPLDCAPGQCYAYQNVAFSLIGDVVFASTGNFYEREVERRLFKPLGMNDASMGLAGIESSPRWARPHVRNRNGWTALTPKPAYYRLAPAAGINASISDMAQWLIAQTGHRPDVLPAPLLATLHAPVISTPGEMRTSWRHARVQSAGYALGWRVYDYAGHPLVFHAGAVQGYRGMLAMLPERDFGVAILWNSSSHLPSGLLPTILDRALGLPAQQWLDLPDEDDLMLAESTAPAEDRDNASGSAANRATASPQ
ncbi:serine hydrolase domain-containing protein [Pseudoxanthomonas sangjuensis]|uniref:serine hydrolase domain-containing protein n=1 Tax=Pseudoxanthomonas sangjuensis TaxID=1503750 RepID=UPI001391A666|nr:serine hydrolase domain-containing protein [Pseudoxanthomonas sangjuensis]KAF1711041.1 serine hydrolase [Pseudoxanthomonas sangjuensis]